MDYFRWRPDFLVRSITLSLQVQIIPNLVCVFLCIVRRHICFTETKFLVSNVFSFILNIVSRNLQHENKQMDILYAFDLQEIERVVQYFYVLTFFIFKLAADIVIYLSSVIALKWKSFEIGSSYSQNFSMKTVHNTTLSSFSRLQGI